MIDWRLGPSTADVAVTPAYSDRLSDLASAEFLAATGFQGRVGQVFHVPGLVLFGLGASGEVSADTVRHAAGCLAREVRGYEHLAVSVSSGLLGAFVEGFVLGAYRFTRYQSAVRPEGPRRVDLVGSAGDAEELRVALVRAEAVVLARDLVSEPGSVLTPVAFADRAVEVARATGLDCEVWDERRIAEERLGGLLGVAGGSRNPPRLVRLRHLPDNPAAPIALVGKGVTFDAGGLSLKPTPQMIDMKADMAGAATVLAAMSALVPLSCPRPVEAWLPLTENMPTDDPMRIGDILRVRNGTTVEIRNADAEGRLILADALVLAGESTPAAIVDVATLTDAAAIALGRDITAVMGNNQPLIDAVLSAAVRAGEPMWPLPLPSRYQSQLDSSIADLVNYTTGVRHGTALLAGLFLQHFIPATTPWAHLDIQGTALTPTTHGEHPQGPTGTAVRTLIDLVSTPLSG
ncbi:leucyl aminopeptidase [Actinokineospora globicatena]|uniref:leucyl aminopeptidase n=1 Tax=Actinokineospora globicatena TaxID=103729 RepID=UPI0020A2AEB2|nr:leucyl aminopeptidase [Actinokineospora globicatena]MCP2303023.1 leucyl aminopeptidase [Actinokineospora globicatena]GLW79868.1 putative cytosol aminopeptidase [Actinokineospora globicatena]GLW85722.1 putative cytosol aminopeptidase [Actinokineospora globicatena]